MQQLTQGLSLFALLPACQQDVQLQNAGAWANLTAAPAAAPGGAAPAAPAARAGGAGEGGAGEDDNLWSEFQGREQQQLQVRGCSCVQQGRAGSVLVAAGRRCACTWAPPVLQRNKPTC